MMQSHLHQLQQQLTSLLSVAIPPPVDTAVSSLSSPEAAAPSKGIDDSSRIAAVDSLRRAILYPPNALLLPHCAHFLSQGFSQLLSDKSYGVRKTAATSYASLCAVLASATLSTHVHAHVQILCGGLVEGFLAWALPLLGDFPARSGSAELALNSLREFLSSGDATSIERYVPSILKACQELLEDERTSPSLLHQLLTILTLISLKFFHCFQPHFIDIVDLLLGWAFMPDLSDSGARIITDSFLQFRKHWLTNVQFSLGLLSKLLGDAQVIIHDESAGTSPQLSRLLSLFSCFSTILQATASGVSEKNLLGQITEPLENLTPQLLSCISMFGRKYGWSKWMGESWKCLTLLAEILNEKLSRFYPMIIDILFHSARQVPSYQVLGLLKTNLQLLSLQKMGLLPTSVEILLQFHSPLSQLRLHSNHSVVAISATTYFYFLQHGCDDVVSQAMNSLFEEMELLRRMLAELHLPAADSGSIQVDTDHKHKINLNNGRKYSELDLLSLIKFDLKVISCSVSVDAARGVANQTITAAIRNERSSRVTSFILDKFLPFQFPIEGLYDLQAHVIKTLCKISEVEFLTKLTDNAKDLNKGSSYLSAQDLPSFEACNKKHILIAEYLSKFSGIMVRCLNVSSSLTVKMEALGWIRSFSQMVSTSKEDDQIMRCFYEPYQNITIDTDLLHSILDAAFDRELKVRSHIAPVLEFLLQAGLIHPENFCFVSEVAINKLSDPDMNIKNTFVRLISIAIPVSLYIHGITDRGYLCKRRPTTEAYMNWKQALSLKQMPQKLHSQQLVSVLNYISQRWKVPHSSWIRQLVFSYRGRKDGFSNQEEIIGDHASNDYCEDAKADELMLQKTFQVNSLAAIWWSVNEAARYCINLRLRSNLGGPAQTFAALERMLLDIPNILKLDFEQNEGQYLGSSNFHMLPIRLLLDFVEALKKNAYNAYEGSAVLSHATRQSSLFFRANKKVCEEWFSRICEPMLNASFALNCHDATFYYCSSRLQELKKLPASPFKDKTHGKLENFQNLNYRFTGDILKVLQHASLALCKGHEPEALIGLQKWVGMMFPPFFAVDTPLISSVNDNDMHFSWMTGLVYQAQGQYEKAAAHFSHLLQSEEALGSIGSDGIQFIIACVIECYTSLSDWKSLESWLSELQALRLMHAGKPYSGALTAAGNEMNAIHALARFDEGDIQAAWGYLDLTPKSSCQLTLDPKLAFERSEQMLLLSMLQKDGSTNKVHADLDKAKVMLDEALSCIPLDGLTEAAPLAIQLHCIFALEECKTSGQQLPSILDSFSQTLHSPISRVRQDSNLWMKIFRVYCTIMPASYATNLLGQRILSLARKQSNFMLASRLKKYLQEHPLSEHKHAEFLAVNLQYEEILLKNAAGENEEALLDLWSFVCADFKPGSTACFSNISTTKAKACLKLASWMSRKSSNINLKSFISKIHEDLTFLSRANGTSICSREIFLSSNSSQTSDTKWNAVLEEIIGTSTKLSNKLCPKLGKAWLSYAAWCFTQAKNSFSGDGPVLQSCSLSSILSEEISPVRCQLTEDEKSKVKSIVTGIYHSRNHVAVKRNQESGHFDSISYPEYQDFLDSLVHDTIFIMEAAAGTPGFESFDGECPSVILFSELQSHFFRKIAGMEKSDTTSYIHDLIEIWWSLRKRRVSLFGYAAHGYFQFLSYSSSGLKESNCTNFQPDHTIEKSSSCILRSMLYILVILLNFGVELEETLNHGFATVPPLSWQEIIPQLFARLSSHPQQAVRKQIEGLLMILAKLSPCSIVYPLLVNLNAYDGQSSLELQSIKTYLSNLYPKLIQDVWLVINELGGITILWEEQWLSTLQDLRPDVVRRINMLKEEASRIADNSSLCHAEKNKINAAKYSAMMAPIVVALERRLASTSRDAETVHEQWFQKEYGKQLKSAIFSFKTAPSSASALDDVWQSFDAIAAALAIYQRKSIFYLREVAPKLALLSSSNVPMPGLEREISLLDVCGSTSAVQGIITISSFNEQLEILSTKTRPKKLALLGSDGKKYTYLLKGREDLRLDARIMQLLQAINGFFISSADSLGQSIGVRHYSVTPISGQAGLIQWVDNVISIYSVYKSWQYRSQLTQCSATGAINFSSPVPQVPRPSDMFYGKIIPALKEKGIRRVISRRDWPHEVKRKVLLDLMQETPEDLLWQEMWCSSEGFKAFHSKTRRFSGGVAAMSIIGHVLGLGDRHLDNILMDFITGEVVHIDYNVCFDKGRRLKIPEIVPFRLTQTIVAALGLTGVEGIFRANCETVINILRKNKDIVLMLLEVFVWDPLMEWTREAKHDEAAVGGEEKKGMELAVSLSMFASRFQEIRVPLQEHRDLLVSSLPAAECALKRFLDTLIRYESLSTVFHHTDKERSSLLQHETTAKSFAAEITAITEKSRAYFEAQANEFTQAKSLATEKAQEATAWMEEHGRVLDALRSGSFPNSQVCIALRSMEEALSLKSAVLVSGVPLTVVPEPTQAQCYDLDREMSSIIAELDNGLSSGIEALHEYALALQVLPFNYITTSPVNSFAQILQHTVNNLSSEVLRLAIRQSADIMTKDQGTVADSIQKRHHDLFGSLERFAMEIEIVDKQCSEQMNLTGLDTEAKSKELLLSAFFKHMQSVWYGSREDDFHLNHLGKMQHDGSSDLRLLNDPDENKGKALCILHIAISELYMDVKENLISISKFSSRKIIFKTDDSLPNDSDIGSAELEEQIEKCVLLAGFVIEIQEFIGIDLGSFSTDDTKLTSEHCWASVFQAILHSIKQLIEMLTCNVLPEIIQSVVSSSAEVMEAFGSLSRVRGSIHAALEKIAEVEKERASLLELEKNYFIKVGLITEQQLSLEEASVRGRDHLSWEETEELATQGDACRAQLDSLHLSWNEKDARITSLARMEADISNSLSSLEGYFSSLIGIEEDGESHTKGSKSLLFTLVKPFTKLESVDQMLSSYASSGFHSSGSSCTLPHLMSGFPLFDSIWRFSHILKKHSFFIWKIGVVDSVLDSCIHEISSSVDHNIRFDQLCNALKKKLGVHLQEYIGQYLKERVVPAFLAHLDRENKKLHQKIEEMDLISDITNDYSEAVRRVKLMLEEYCNAHETARAARSAAYIMKRHVNDLTEALHKTTLEIIQLEWMHEQTPLLHKNKVFLQNTSIDNKLLNISRGNLLEKVQSSVSSIARSLESLQALEKTSIAAEGKLERAMVWACAGSNTVGSFSSSTNCSRIPSEFHNHLSRRRKLLWTAQQHASDVIKICTYVIEFEASRDGLNWVHGENFSEQTGDSRTSQQYVTALRRLDTAHHSFARAEQEWLLSQNKMEAASKGLISATNELFIASVKAKSASADLQGNLTDMWKCGFEASLALSSFISVSEGHTALTFEGGSMLEEVLAITEGLHDIYGLAKEASSVHSALVADLAKAKMILHPLEASLSSDMEIINDAKPKESSTYIPSIHGQALYQSYCFRLQEACQSLASLVPSITLSVNELFSMLTKLARDANTQSGNLHKALEGLGESQVMRSQELSLSRPDFSDGLYANEKIFYKTDEGILPDDNTSIHEFQLDDEGWISPPDCSYTSSKDFSSKDFSITSNDAEENDDGDINNCTKEKLSDEKFKSGSIDEINSSGSTSTTFYNSRIKSILGTDFHASDVREGNFDGIKPVGSSTEHYILSPSKGDEENHDDPTSSNPLSWGKRGKKNAYAVSVLRQVELKIDGRDIDNERVMQASQQVDHLIKEATSIDNLCCMYEGWTPWI